MARMPQIPEPDISNRPGAGVTAGEVQQLDVGAVEAPFSEGAQMAEGVGNKLEELQAQRDAALEKIQGVQDEATALNALGAHRDKLSGMAAQLQQQFKDDPQTAVKSFTEGVGSTLDDALHAPGITDGAAAKMQVMLTRANIDAVSGMKDWALSQGVVNSKNQLKGAEAAATHGLDKFVTPGGVDAYIKGVWKQLGNLPDQLTSNGQAERTKVAQDIVSAWGEQRSSANAKAAQDVLENFPALASKYGIDADETKRVMGLAKKSYEGAQKQAGFDNLVKNHALFGNLTDLLTANDPGFPKAAYAMRQSVLASVAKIEATPGLTDKSKERLREQERLTLSALDAGQDAFRKQRGLSEGEADEKVRSQLFSRSTKLLTEKQSALDTHYDKAFALRHDNLEAFSKGQIPYQTFELVENSIKKSLPSRDALESKNVGQIAAHWYNSSGTRTPRQAGNQRLNDLFDPAAGIYKKMPLASQNDAREGYMRRLYEAATAGNTVDEDAALRMAQESADTARRDTEKK